jgi:hypothetical protein
VYAAVVDISYAGQFGHKVYPDGTVPAVFGSMAVNVVNPAEVTCEKFTLASPAVDRTPMLLPIAVLVGA